MQLRLIAVEEQLSNALLAEEKSKFQLSQLEMECSLKESNLNRFVLGFKGPPYGDLFTLN